MSSAGRDPLGSIARAVARALRSCSRLGLLTTGSVLVCVLIGAILFVDVAHEHAVVEADAGRAAVNLAKSLALQVSDTLEATNCALFGLAERVTSGPAPGGSVEQWMAMQVMMVPRLNELLVIGEHGRVRASSGSDLPAARPGAWTISSATTVDPPTTAPV